MWKNSPNTLPASKSLYRDTPQTTNTEFPSIIAKLHQSAPALQQSGAGSSQRNRLHLNSDHFSSIFNAISIRANRAQNLLAYHFGPERKRMVDDCCQPNGRETAVGAILTLTFLARCAPGEGSSKGEKPFRLHTEKN